MKMLFQTLYTTSMNWDDELDGMALTSASKEVERNIRSSEIQREMASKGIKRDIMIEKALWQAGFYEYQKMFEENCWTIQNEF